tara:strand:+ start:169 stop:507 length:339 start_codon:yes stop_codon:yes gene_type:complete
VNSPDNNLRKIRIQKGMTISDVVTASKGAFKQSRISNYETGARKLSVEAALSLAPIFGVTTSQLLNIDMGGQNIKLGPHQEKLMALLSQVSLRGDEDVRQVIAILQGYLNHK